MELIDTHCHLTDLSDDRVKEVVESAKNSSVRQMICIGASNGSEPNFRAIKIAETHNNIYASIGIHPHDAGKTRWTSELVELAAHPKVVAIGETGLDFNRDWSDFNDQEVLFKESIDLALKLNLPLVIHCRDAHQKTLEILSSVKSPRLRGVFHCFGENIQIAREILNLGFLISLTGIITFKRADELRKTVQEIPLDKLMLETDSPYMAPEPFRGKASEPAHVRILAETLANMHQVSLEEVAKQTTHNAKTLFGIK